MRKQIQILSDGLLYTLGLAIVKMEKAIPQYLVGLKRPALQKLCKRFGIKANGKNVDMRRALEELRDSASSILCNTEIVADIPSNTSLLEDSGSPLDACSVLPPTDFHHELDILSRKSINDNEKGERSERQCSSYSSTNEQSSLTTSCCDVNPLSVSDVSSKSSGAWLRINTESLDLTESQTHDISCIQDVQEELPPLEVKRKRWNLLNFSTESRNLVSEHTQYESPKQSCENLDRDLSISICNKQSCSAPAPFSPPDSGDEAQYSTKRKRNPTYTISDEDNQTELQEDEQPPSKRTRRITFSVSPKIMKCENNDDSNGTCTCVSGGDTQVLSGNADVHSEIMNLLDKKVEETLADPNYKAVFSGSASQSLPRSKSKTVTAKKFDSAHKKNFSRMQSIVSYQSEKERKGASRSSRVAVHSAKRPKLMETQHTSKIPRIPFKPSIQDVKHASFNFSERATATKTMDSGLKLSVDKNKSRNSTVVTKTPAKSTGKPYTFSAKTVTSAKKSQFDISKSLKKKPSYKPHTGKLPDFNISRF